MNVLSCQPDSLYPLTYAEVMAKEGVYSIDVSVFNSVYADDAIYLVVVHSITDPEIHKCFAYNDTRKLISAGSNLESCRFAPSDKKVIFQLV